MIRQSKVFFINDKLEKAFYALQEEDPVRKAIAGAIIGLRKDAFSGTQIPKRLIPKEYIKRYSVNNLWKYDLPKGWRLIYTITADNEVELLSAILDWFGHKEYERKFKY